MNAADLHIWLALAPFLLLLLFGGHAVADYGQQSAYVAEFKVRPSEASARRLGADGSPVLPIVVPRNPDWFVTLAAHCLIHAVIVGAIAFAAVFLAALAMSGQAFNVSMILKAATIASCLGWAEFVIHFLIDDAKGQQRFSYRTDQALHYLCKIVWAAIILGSI